MALEPPQYIAIEGPIGVGKTALAKRLAETFSYETLLETPEANPFLARFYEDRRRAALPVQLFFLFERARHIESLQQNDMFQRARVADFIFEKDQLFAEVNLDSDELKLYQNIADHLRLRAPVPDLVVYLQAPVEVLLARIVKRGIAAERQIDAEYLSDLNDAYTAFFHFYETSPLLIVNAAEIDLVNNTEDYENLVARLLQVKNGRHYYNPRQQLI